MACHPVVSYVSVSVSDYDYVLFCHSISLSNIVLWERLLIACSPFHCVVFLDEGYIKFNIDWVNQPLGEFLEFGELNSWRDKLFSLGLIGVYSNGVGFGNISARVSGSNQFIISGSATGAFDKLSLKHYSEVIDFDFARNWLCCVGGVKASSESLTHAAIYSSLSSVNAVIHVHSPVLWSHLLASFPSTPDSVAYGTKEMALSVGSLLKNKVVLKEKVFAMAGHKDGVVAFGASLSEAGEALLSHFLPLK